MNGTLADSLLSRPIDSPATTPIKDDETMRERGFTLFELLITLLILVLLLTFGMPSFSNQIKNTRTKTVTMELLQSVQHARTLAVSKNTRATLIHLGDWTKGWEVFIDENDNGIRDVSETLVFQTQAIDSVEIHANGPLTDYVSFIGSGESRKVGKANSGSFQAGTFRVCPKTTGEGYELILSRSGRMRIESIPAQRCVAF